MSDKLADTVISITQRTDRARLAEGVAPNEFYRRYIDHINKLAHGDLERDGDLAYILAAMSGQCTPSRSAMLTGANQQSVLAAAWFGVPVEVTE